MLQKIRTDLAPTHTRLIAVSKTRSDEEILHLYHQGQRAFAENRVQDLLAKYERLPKDIEWHQIGHLQTNKVKYIIPFIHLIHAVDSVRLLKEIDKQALKHERIVDVLLQFKIARESTKYGFDMPSAVAFLESPEFKELHHIRILGVMGMGTFTYDDQVTRREFKTLKGIFDQLQQRFFNNQAQFREISMGMSGDYRIAVEEGSTMVRIGSLLFGH